MKKKMTAHSLTIKHKHYKKKGSEFAKNRREEELEQEGKKKHMKHMKRKAAGCAECGSMKHATQMHKHEKKGSKKKMASNMQTNAARFEKMRKKVFGLK